MNPTFTYPTLYKNMANQVHLLIGGCSGSGKSVLLNGIIFSLLMRDPVNAQLVLIDPKKVELARYKRTANAIAYADETSSAIRVLNQVCAEMEKRYKMMQKKGLLQYTGHDIYVIIDEYADLKTTGGKKAEEPVCRIAQLGRAAGIHLILATQRPTSDVITGRIKVNIDAQVALRCRTKQDSRNIVGTDGAETLPRHGQCIYYNPDMMHPERCTVDMIDSYMLEQAIRVRNKERSFWRKRL